MNNITRENLEITQNVLLELRELLRARLLMVFSGPLKPFVIRELADQIEAIDCIWTQLFLLGIEGKEE